MTIKRLFRIETGKDGNEYIKAYQNVPEDYTPKEKEFFNFMEAKQCLISQSGQKYQMAYDTFQYNLGLEEDGCETRDFNSLFLEELSDVEETTTA